MKLPMTTEQVLVQNYGVWFTNTSLFGLAAQSNSALSLPDPSDGVNASSVTVVHFGREARFLSREARTHGSADQRCGRRLSRRCRGARMSASRRPTG